MDAIRFSLLAVLFLGIISIGSNGALATDDDCDIEPYFSYTELQVSDQN